VTRLSNRAEGGYELFMHRVKLFVIPPAKPGQVLSALVLYCVYFSLTAAVSCLADFVEVGIVEVGISISDFHVSTHKLCSLVIQSTLEYSTKRVEEGDHRSKNTTLIFL
jgi:hypothetical protein